MKKTGIQKLEKKVEIRTELLIELMEYVELKLIEEGKDTSRIDGILTNLREEAAVQKQINLEARIARKLYMKEYRKKNKEKIKQLNKEYREKNPEKMKQYGKEYREKKKMERIDLK
ncbi:hypothetical protein [Carnobacterium inhibens]|uniref:Uncharacterized protein n=1 Tax=Carnobacterium inhibens TaxID=147709 RepID=A0ABR7TGV3_9LACT|nr:hypothetical protein [Carnobacterium inhibens]MBC9826434.1 hypothetical protein [Carnobacterium inhibens]